MNEIFKKAGRVLREHGFRGSGQNYRKDEDGFIFCVNFQRSRWGDGFFVNLGAQPAFIPAEPDTPHQKIVECVCVWRDRVGELWPPELSEQAFEQFSAELVTCQRAFFDQAKTLRTAITMETPDVLAGRFRAGTPPRSLLHLARAALALGHPELARTLANRSLETAGDNAKLLIEELRELLARLDG